MNAKTLISMGTLAAVLAGCGGNDGITLAPSNTAINSNNTTGGGSVSNNPCANYQVSGQTFQGQFDGDNCIYDVTFVSDTRPLVADLNIPALSNDGVHIFEDSLWVGEDVNASAAAAGVSIPQDGEGPTLTVAPGAKIAFSAPQDYVRIARGSRIIAEGTESSPIIFSATADLIDGTATESDRGLWGGIQINGNGLTNKCTDAERLATGSNPHNCHITSEGRPATYGGNNNDENSGVLKYVQIRHAGYEVVDGDELNGLTLNAIGAGTTIEFVQTYTTQDDGFEMFGGAVNMKNIVAVNVGDDSIDYSEGYTGNIQFALVVHTSGGNRCIEGDNTGDSRPDDIAPYSKLRISNMTCVTSNVDEGAGTDPSAKGDSEGPLFREGVYFEMYNSLITSNEAVMTSNECFELSSTQSIDGVDTFAYSVALGNVIACTEALKGGADAVTLRNWWEADNAVVDDPLNLPASVIDGLDTDPRSYITAASLTDANAAPIAVTVYDVTQLEDSFDAQAIPALGGSGSSSFFESVDFVGAVSAGDDWVSGWTTGL
ncbi:hypothetical protein [Aurantivibrio plasticivorans]